MRAVIQRVTKANVSVAGKTIGSIGPGILTLLGIDKGATEEQARQLIEKIIQLRIFPDAAGKMNLSLEDIHGGHLIVSQFTLSGDTSTGRRPSFTTAESPDRARALFEIAVAHSRTLGIETSTGEFQADMKVELVNDGPATFIVNAKSDAP